MKCECVICKEPFTNLKQAQEHAIAKHGSIKLTETNEYKAGLVTIT